MIRLESSNETIISKFNCRDDIKNTQVQQYTTTSCLSIYEVNFFTIRDSILENKKSKDSPLLIIQNKWNQQSQINIIKGIVQNLKLFQTSPSSQLNPIQIICDQASKIKILETIFQQNTLIGFQNSLVFSVTGVWVQNVQGETQISESQFKSSESNSKYNFLYIQSSKLLISSSQFQKSSYTKKQELINKNPSQDINQEGGFIRANIKELNILNSFYKESVSSKGSFMYIESFGQKLTATIINSNFTDGYSTQDGSALYFDINNIQFEFLCQNCLFNNFYNFNLDSSVIAFKNQANNQAQQTIEFNQGIIKNIFGVSKSQFVKIENNIKLTFNDVKEISNDITPVSNSYQLSTLLSVINSQAYLFGCEIYSLSILNDQYPLLIDSTSSLIDIKKTIIRDLQFQFNLINIQQNGNLTISDSKFFNITYFKKLRILGANNQLLKSSLMIISNSSVKIQENSLFQEINCQSTCSGSVAQLKNSNFTLQDSKFLKSNAYEGGILFIEELVDQNLIQSCVFENNSAERNGGVIFMYSSSDNEYKMDIISSNFTDNISIKGYGGGMFLRSESTQNLKQQINIYNSQIINNQAFIGGGGISYQGISPLIDEQSIIRLNKAYSYGKDLMSYPTQLKIIKIQQFLSQNHNIEIVNEQIKIKSFRSGDQFPIIEFQMVNFDNEIIIPQENEENYKIKAQISESTQNSTYFYIRGSNETEYKINKTDRKQSKIIFDQIQIIGIPGQKGIIEFYSDAIKVLKNNQFFSDYSFKILIEFRNCQAGEFLSTYNEYQECEFCPQGKYSLDAKACIDCPDGGICEYGKKLLVKEGYWRSSEDTDQILKCSSSSANCIGGSSGNSICKQGSIGALCEECDIYGEVWEESYSKQKNACYHCSESKAFIWKLLLITLWTLGSLLIAVKRDEENLIIKRTQTLLQKYFKNRQNKSNSQLNLKANLTNQANLKSNNVYLKIFFNYIFIISSIEKFNLNFTKNFEEILSFVGKPLDSSVGSLNCFLKNLNTDIPIIYITLIFSLLIVLIHLFMFIIGVKVEQIVQKVQQYPYYKLYTASIFFTLYYQPDLITQMVSLVSCRRIGDSDYILANVSYKCNESDYNLYTFKLVTPFLILWMFIIPVILFVKLYLNRNNLEQFQIQQKYGFLYKEYKLTTYYWDFIKMFLKITIILSLNFYSQYMVIKGQLVLLAIAAYGILLKKLKPYKEEEINQLDMYQTSISFISVFLVIFITDNKFDYLYYPTSVILILVNVQCILTFMAKIFKSHISNIKMFIEKGKKLIIEKYFKRYKIQKYESSIKQSKLYKIRPELKSKVYKILKDYVQESKDNMKNSFKCIYAKYQDQKQKQILKMGIVSEQDLNSKGNSMIFSNEKMFSDPLISEKYLRSELEESPKTSSKYNLTNILKQSSFKTMKQNLDLHKRKQADFYLNEDNKMDKISIEMTTN